MSTQRSESNSLQSIVLGARRANGIAVSSGLFGLLYGAACASFEISAPLAALASLMVFSGAVQFAALPLLDEPLAVGALAISTLLVCNRLILMSAAIAPHLTDRPAWFRYPALHLVTDGAWAATVSETSSVDRSIFFVGAGAWILLLWVLGTMAGVGIAGFLGSALIAELRFSGILFLGLLLLLVASKSAVGRLPWIVSGMTAATVSLVLPLWMAYLIALGIGAGLAVVMDGWGDD